MKKIKSKAEIFVEQFKYLEAIRAFRLFPEKGVEVDIAYLNTEGGCELEERSLTPEQALELAGWLIETFGKEVKE